MKKIFFLTGYLILFGASVYAGKTRTPEQSQIDSIQLRELRYRCIGPYRGGRSAAVTGVPGNPSLYYMGSTGGGVWRSTNAGNSWENISDGFFGGSIGSIAVAESDQNVIYVGGGEVTVRGNVSHGDGVWKSTDAGKTWKNMGLNDSRHIPRIRVHPKDHNLVYVAALGHLFGPNKERGIFKSEDGGQTWKKVLFVSEDAGAVDLILDPNNPRNMFASFWNVRRTPFGMESGGKGSGIWKSTDGGENWENIKQAKGLPKGVWGISGLTISPQNSERMWAIIENKNGGVFRSDDGGKTWKQVNAERKLRQRAWYYSRIFADPLNEDQVYVVNVRFHRSKDGGKTYESISTPHGDHHDLWINPDDPENMVIGDDGGAQVTVDGGRSWTTYHNQPTAQFYRVITDNHFPYRIYAAQQDNSTVRIPHRTSSWRGITERDWEPTAGGESGHIAIDPEDEDVVFGGSYDGYLSRYNHRTEEYNNVTVWPDNPMGWGAKDLKYRFQWNFPIFFSSKEPYDLYAAGNVLFRSTDHGQSWTAISPDLTRNDSTKLGPSGGPITKDNTSVEYYCTIFSACEANNDPNVIWTGSDDGLIHVTRDKGKTWKNVTPPRSIMPEWIMINSIEPHPSNPGGAYVAATMYKSDDFQPYLYKTEDYGVTWSRINQGIPDDEFTRVIRADPDRPGLLFAGTEKGIHVSFDNGSSWTSFQQNLPQVPITDMRIKNGDLVVATQGRSLWVLDNLSPLSSVEGNKLSKENRLYPVRDNHLLSGGKGGKTAGKNPPSGVVFRYELAGKVDSSTKVEFKILDSQKYLIFRYSTSFSKEQLKENTQFRELKDLKEGMNALNWNGNYPSAEGFENLIMWSGGLGGPKAPPGEYRARLIVGNDSFDQEFKILPDPRKRMSQEDYIRRFQAALQVNKLLSRTNKTIREIREVKSQVNDWKSKLDTAENKELMDFSSTMLKDLSAIENSLYQTKNQSPQDPLNFPIRLNDKLAGVGGNISYNDGPPTRQSLAVFQELSDEIEEQIASWDKIKEERVPEFNQKIRSAKIKAIKISE